MDKNITKKKIFKYLEQYYSSIKYGKIQSDIFNQIILELKKIKINNKIHIFGNGGSASIASHFSMDLTNNTKIRCFNYNDPSIITCFSNDYKFENWIKKVIEKYGNKDDVAILISSSGKSKNMINGVKAAKKKRFKKIITLTGFEKDNNLRNIGDLNLWINSKNYNVIESTHHLWLLMIVDLMKK